MSSFDKSKYIIDEERINRRYWLGFWLEKKL